MSAADGGPAFPRALPKGEFPPEDVLRIIEQHAGMTLRDYFAIRALQTLLLQLGKVPSSSDEIASAAYGMADKMLRARRAE